MLYSDTEMCLSNAIVCLSKRVSYDNDCSDNYNLACLIGILSQVNLDVDLCDVAKQLKTLDEFYVMLCDCLNNGVISYQRYRSIKRVMFPVYKHFEKMRDSLNAEA